MKARATLPGLIVLCGFLLSYAIVAAGGKGGGGGYVPPPPPAACCSTYYYCSGNDLGKHHADCTDSVIQTCPDGCRNSACNP